MPDRPLPDVFRRDRRAAHGLSAGHVVAQLAAGRWQLVSPTVVVTHNGPLSRCQQLAAALLCAGSAGSPAALAAWTALEVHGLSGWERRTVHLLVPRGRHVPELGDLDLRVHSSRRFVAADARHVRDLARTSVERSALDAASWSPTPRAAAGVVAACVQQRLTSAGRLLRELEAMGQVHRTALLRAVLLDVAGGAQAVSERDFLAFCRRHRLGRPVLQVPRRDRAGRRRYLDATFRTCSGGTVHVEVDGALHLVASTYWEDMRRGNDLLLAGVVVLRFPSLVVHTDDPDAVRQLRDALAR